MNGEEIQSVLDEVRDAERFGKVMCEPPPHYERLFRLFTKEERLEVLDYVYQFYISVDFQQYSPEQLVAYSVIGERSGYLEALANGHGVDLGDEDIIWSPSQVDIDWLSPAEHAYLAAIIRGDDPSGLAALFANEIVSTQEIVGEELIHVMKTCIDRPIHSPELAAAVSECLRYNERLLDAVSHESRGLADFALALPVEDALRPHDLAAYRDEAQYLLRIAEVDLPLASRQMFDLRQELALIERFRMVETEYGLLVPRSFHAQLTKQFTDLVETISRDRSELLSLSPRRFEEFMADLFRAMNYEVELTKATGDGGVDLLCLKNLDGIPFRMAVELKRYKEGRPITVQLVRSFVGANAQWNANKLLYVTTSSYTKPAIHFADTYAKHLLSLKDYSQIRDWCAEAGRDEWVPFRGRVR